MKPPRSAMFAPVMAPLFILARRGQPFESIAFTYMFLTIFLLVIESLHPQVRLRKKPLPEPEIRLNIDNSSK